MTKSKAFLAGVVIAASAFAAGVLAQPIVSQNLTGNECWNAGQGPGGPSTGFVCAYVVRNTTGIGISTGAATQTITNLQSDIILTAQPASGANITLPASPVPDGFMVEIINGTTAAFATN